MNEICGQLINWFPVAFLSIGSITDIRKKILPKKMILIGAIAAIILTVIWQRRELLAICLSVFPGAFLLILSYLSKEQIGYGDGICILVLGILTPIEALLVQLMLSFTLLFMTSAVLLMLKKGNKKTRIPYIPYLLMGVLLQQLLLPMTGGNGYGIF